MNASEAHAALLQRGYSSGQADLAVTRAGQPGGYVLSRHRVTMGLYGPGGGYEILPVPWPEGGPRPADQDPGLPGTWHWDVQAERRAEANRERAAIQDLADGHQLAREQISGHGKDRYPAIQAQYAKVLDEAGELGEALMDRMIAIIDGADGTALDKASARIRGEYADVGLALFELGNKLGLNLTECMAEVVRGDKRRFA